MGTQTLFDEDYFEFGVETRKSCYEWYHWLGKPTLEYCDKVIRFLGLSDGETLLDYGCAKGFYTKAFRLLGVDAIGCDISEYAIENCDPDVEWWVFLTEVLDDLDQGKLYDILFSKDVFEHIKDLDPILEDLSGRCESALIGVPLGDDGKYRLPRSHYDITHIHCENEDWWLKKFQEYFNHVSVYYKIPGIILREEDDSKGYGYFLCR